MIDLLEWRYLVEIYSITGKSKLIDEGQNVWGFLVDKDDGEEILLSDDYFSSSIVVALDEITHFLKKKEIREGQRVKITIETESCS